MVFENTYRPYINLRSTAFRTILLTAGLKAIFRYEICTYIRNLGTYQISYSRRNR